MTGTITDDGLVATVYWNRYWERDPQDDTTFEYQRSRWTGDKPFPQLSQLTRIKIEHRNDAADGELTGWRTKVIAYVRHLTKAGVPAKRERGNTFPLNPAALPEWVPLDAREFIAAHSQRPQPLVLHVVEEGQA